MPFASAHAGSAGHVRAHLSLLAPSEKRALVWIARRLPRWVGSDHLSLLGLGSMVAAGLSLALLDTGPAVPVVVLCLFANWFGDSLDGTLARVREQQRPRYGYYVDHVIDLAGVTALLAGLAASDIMSPLVALGVLTAYLLVSGESYLATHATGVFRISFLGVGPTELRVLLAIGLAKVTQSSEVTLAGISPVRLFDAGGIAAAVALGIVFVVSAAGNTRTLYRAEPLPPRNSRRQSTRSARTSIPAASSPALTDAESAAAPGVSPCTQIVRAARGRTVPSTATTACSLTIRIARGTATAGSVRTAPG